MNVVLPDVEGVPLELGATKLSCRLYISKENKIKILGSEHRSTRSTDTFYDSETTTKELLTFLRCRDGVYEQRSLDLTPGVHAYTAEVVSGSQIIGKRVLVKYSFTRHDLNLDDILPPLEESSLPFRLSIYLDEITSGSGYSVICVKAAMPVASVRNQEDAVLNNARNTITTVREGLAAKHQLLLFPGYSKFMYMMRIINAKLYATLYMPHDPIHSVMYTFMESKVAQHRDPHVKAFLFDMLIPPEHLHEDGEDVDWTDLEDYRETIVHTEALTVGLPAREDFYYGYSSVS
jgi:hypothetical protein